jgi:RimJ/RimL family protein N-acetyltransferase
MIKRHSSDQPAELVLRPALPADADYFIELYNREVEERHFARWQSSIHPLLFAMAVKEDLIPHHQWPLIRDPKKPHNNKILKADLFIAESQSMNIGCIALCEPTPGTYHATAELWMVIVDPEHHDKGYGGRLLNLALDRLVSETPDRRIISWCFPASQPMFRMLQRRGFQMFKRTADDVRHLERLPKK